MLDLNFWKSTEPINDLKSLIKEIYKTIKCYYNNRYISAEQKALLKADSKIKYFIAEILRVSGIWHESNGTIIINSSMAESFHNEFTTHEPPIILQNLYHTIIQITSQTQTQAFVPRFPPQN